MAKLKAKINTKCNKCNTKRLMAVSVVKNRSSSALGKTNRRKDRAIGRGPDKGRFGKVPAKSSKTCKKANLLITCTICNIKRPYPRGRVGKLELIN